MPGLHREAHWRLPIAGSQSAAHTGTNFIQDLGVEAKCESSALVLCEKEQQSRRGSAVTARVRSRAVSQPLTAGERSTSLSVPDSVRKEGPACHTECETASHFCLGGAQGSHWSPYLRAR